MIKVIGAMQEKRINRGEDSDPICFVSTENTPLVVLGVFDGLGGAGATECVSEFSVNKIHKTQAYVASRIIGVAIRKLLEMTPNVIRQKNFLEILNETIKSCYLREKEKYPVDRKPLLRSSLIKEYPTTMALITLYKGEGKYQINSYWAGDSRNYLWTKDGFFQISNDDLKGDLDPLLNLRNDAPMSNCLHADGEFEIHHKHIDEFQESEKFVIIAATDGCFGYYPTPMDFEKVLQTTLRHSHSYEKWKENLLNEFGRVTSDDFSFSIGIIGFNHFNELKKSLKLHNPSLDNYFNETRKLGILDKLYKRLISIKQNKINKEVSRIWPQYKKEYLKYLNK